MASAFGVFQIVANDGRQDAMLMATELLNQRIAQIKMARQQAGFAMQDQYPTILDIERTHIIFPTAHFKPFAAIAFEYHREEPEGQARLNANIRYSIAQYGDFFADMVHYMKFVPLTYTSASADPNKDVFRYADFVGERLHKLVKFTVNGNNLDSFTNDCYVTHRKFCIAPNKIDGYKRLVGQELSREAYLAQSTSTQPLSRTKLEVFDGYQTPRKSHPALEVTVPLLFWFCRDFRLSIPSVAIPYGQRFITIQTPESSELVELVSPASADGSDTGSLGPLEFDTIALYVNNLFVNAEIHDIFIRRIGFTLIRVHLWHEQELSTQTGRVKLDSLQWPVECLYFGFRPVVNYDVSQARTALSGHSMYGRLGGFGTLQNWDKFSHVALTTEGVAGVQSCVVDSDAQAELTALETELRALPLTFWSDTGRTPAVVGAAFNALASVVAARTSWAISVIDEVRASLALAGVVLIAGTNQTASQTLAFQALNEHSESVAWATVADVAGTAAAQVAAYQAALSDWDNLADTTQTSVSADLLLLIASAADEFGATSTSVWDAVQASGLLSHKIRLGNCAQVEVKRQYPVAATVGLSAHNVKLYDQQYSSFFTAYLPYQYGGPNLNAPSDDYLHLISFALYPNTYQPSGHINVSRTREFYISYSAVRTVDTASPIQLYVQGQAINFLLIADGSASLRYTT